MSYHEQILATQFQPMQGPALGLRFRHQVWGHAHERRYFGWRDVLGMDLPTLGEVISDAVTADEAIARVQDWASLGDD